MSKQIWKYVGLAGDNFNGSGCLWRSGYPASD